MDNANSEARTANRNPFAIDLSGAAIEVLHGLFFEGPMYDGDVPSKSGRDELVTFGLALRCNGWQQLTKKGLEMALIANLDRQKEKLYRQRRKAINLLHAVEPVMNPEDLCVAARQSIEMAMKRQDDKE